MRSRRLKYINEKVEQFKHEDGNLYAIYGTPAESLCGLQVEQFRKKYGIVEGVSDRRVCQPTASTATLPRI